MGLYSLLLLAVLVLGAPYWLLRMATSGRYRAGLAGRLGLIPPGLRAATAGRRVIWLHAVSVGELITATQLIRELQDTFPEWIIAVSTTTATGQRLAKERLPGVPVFNLPLDFAFTIRRYLHLLRPKVLILMESELWPRLIVECAKNHIPVAVVNTRISDRSFPRYMRLRRLWQPLLAKISLFLAQSSETAERLVRIGAPAERVSVTGNLKYDIRATRQSPLTETLRSHLTLGTKVVVCGSTLDGEERLLLEAWPGVLAAEPNTVMVLAPRHPDRFQTVSGIISAGGISPLRASAFREQPSPVPPGSVFLLDTIGDLASLYSLATAAFVGGSLIPEGGHNPLEPARFAVPVIMGPSYENFREIVEVMRTREAIRIISPAHLTETLVDLLKNPADAQTLGERGQAVFEAQAGATKRTLEALTLLLRQTAEPRQ